MSNSAEIIPLRHPVQARTTVPGSKSITNRAMVAAALADGVTTLHGASDANDSLIMAGLLHTLGTEIETIGNRLAIKGNCGKFKPFSGTLNAHDAGTVMRFLCALCCMVPGEIIFEGSDRMQQRPIGGLTEALRHLGAEITYLKKEGFPPLKINGGKIKGGKTRLNASQSSQFVSALLMIAPLLEGSSEIICDGEIASPPYIKMTLSVLESFGIIIRDISKGHYLIEGNSHYAPAEYFVEGDASSASYLFAVAALTGSTVEVTNLPPLSLQSDSAFAGLLAGMGCRVSKDKTITVTGCDTLKPITADLSAMPDIAQTLAVVAAFAEGESILTGLKTLQFKETERITALKNELGKMGIACEATADSLRIKGGKPAGAQIQTYGDHRMAMAFAVAGTKIPGVFIQDPGVVKKSFPRFWNVLSEMGITVKFT
jgi:3-phosphoshikimate 1-carboxyvinyltransferase